MHTRWNGWWVGVRVSAVTIALSLIAVNANGGPLLELPLPPDGGAPARESASKSNSELKGAAIPYPSLLVYEKSGDADTTYFGYSVDGGADVDGDGVPDFIVGSPLASPNGVMNAGSAFVYSGSDGSLLYQINGTDSGQVFGVSVAMVGDVNGDNRADFLIGAPYADPGGLSDAGSAYLYSGMNGILLQQKDGVAPDDNFGWSVARAGMINADAIPDYVIGAPYADSGSIAGAGIVYVFSGAGGGLLFRKFGDSASVNLGWSVAGAGDVNVDGRADIIASAPYADSDSGAVYVYSGLTQATLYHVTGDTAGASFGYSVSGMGDVDGDGYRDFGVGASGWRTNTGAAYVYSGAYGTPLLRVEGSANSFMGYSVAGADVNGDGKNDAIFSAPGTDVNGVFQAGVTHIYSVLDGVELHRSAGAGFNAVYGFDVANVGDVNGDGRHEFIVGSPALNQDGMYFVGGTYVRAWGAFEEITDLTDVGNDQGRQIRIEWSNIPGNDGFIQEFAIYRRVDGGLKSDAVDPYDLKSTPPGEWDFVKSVPARGDSVYSAVVPTLRDSTVADGMWWTAFFVSGIGENPVDHFDSPVDSGYSLDNLAPAPPAALFAAQAGPDVDLDWKSTSAADFDYYWVYRDTVPGFSVAPEKRIGSTSDTSFVDNAPPSASGVYYKVSAVDFSGNEGAPSTEATTSACACNCHANPECDGFVDIFDVTRAVNVAFRDAAPILDPNVSCPYQTTDVDCSGLTDIFDVIRIINVAFRNGNPATEFCQACP